MSFKRGKKYGPNQKKYAYLCEWCGVQFKCSRPDAQCCSDRHRLKLHRWRRAYLKQFGYAPTTNPRGDNERQRWFEPVKM